MTSKHLQQVQADAEKLTVIAEGVMEASNLLREKLAQVPASRDTSLAVTKLDEFDFWAGRALSAVLQPLLQELHDAGLLEVVPD